MVRLEDVTAALCGVEFAQDFSPDLVAVAALPDTYITVAADAKTMPILLPQFVTVIPTFVFLEATLAVLGLGDPNIPTWGKIIYDARVNDALYMGDYYWMVLPAALLMLIGFGFALVGYSLDRILNPRLRTMS